MLHGVTIVRADKRNDRETGVWRCTQCRRRDCKEKPLHSYLSSGIAPQDSSTSRRQPITESPRKRLKPNEQSIGAFDGIPAIAPDKRCNTSGLAKTQQSNLQMQLFGLLRDQTENGEKLVATESSPPRGIHRFFAPTKRQEEKLLHAASRSSPTAPASLASHHAMKMDREISTQAAEEDGLTNKQPTIPSQVNFSYIEPTPNTDLVKPRARYVIDTMSQFKEWRSCAQGRSSSIQKVFKPALSTCEVTRDLRLGITLGDVEREEPPSQSLYLPPQQSDLTNDVSFSIAPLDCSKVRALSEPPTRHCVNSIQPVSLLRRHSLDMVDLSGLAHCSICKQKVFASKKLTANGDYQWLAPLFPTLSTHGRRSITAYKDYMLFMLEIFISI